ncbi:transcription initiation factor IIB [Clarireedia jacksonii]
MMSPPLDKATEWTQNLNVTVMCKDCKEIPPNLVEEFSSGDLVCDTCGVVIGDRIVDTRSEWRTFSNDDQGNDDPSRVGDAANPLLNGSQLQTTIAFGDSSARSRELYRAQGKQGVDKATKGLLAAYKEIGAHCDAVNIPKNVSDTAKHLFKLVDDAKAFKGKSQEAIVAGCIFIACRQCGVPRTFREIFALTKVSKKDIGRTFKVLEKFFADSSAKKATAEATGGKLRELGAIILININMKSKGFRLQTVTRLLRQPMPKTSAPVTAVSLVSRTNNSLRSLKVSLRRSRPSAISLVDPPCQLQPPASTWPQLFSASPSLLRRYPKWLVLAMVLSVRHTSICTQIGKDLSSLSGLLGARAKWITFLSVKG